MKQVLLRSSLVVLAMALSIGAFGKSKSENLTLAHDATLNGTNLPAGDYTVKYDVNGANAEVKFVKNGKEVASANGQVKTLAKKAGSNQVVLNTSGDARSIAEIDFGGKDTAISFDASGTTAGK